MGGEGVVTDEERVRALVASLAEPVVVLDSERRLVAASPAAVAALGDAVPGRRVGEDVGGALVLFVGDLPELSAYQELRAGFTAAVSHELRTPLARMLVLLETASLPGADVDELVEQARQEIQSDARPDRRRAVPRRARDGPGGRLARPHACAAGARGDRGRVSPTAPRTRRSTLQVTGGAEIELPLRPRMLRVVVENLVANSIRYAGPGSTCRISRHAGGRDAAAHRRRRRRGASTAGRRAAVRALLPRRHRALVARHRARARDRQAHRHLGRRLGRGARRAGPRARDRLPLPGLVPRRQIVILRFET